MSERADRPCYPHAAASHIGPTRDDSSSPSGLQCGQHPEDYRDDPNDDNGSTHGDGNPSSDPEPLEPGPWADSSSSTSCMLRSDDSSFSEPFLPQPSPEQNLEDYRDNPSNDNDPDADSDSPSALHCGQHREDYRDDPNDGDSASRESASSHCCQRRDDPTLDDGDPSSDLEPQEPGPCADSSSSTSCMLRSDDSSFSEPFLPQPSPDQEDQQVREIQQGVVTETDSTSSDSNDDQASSKRRKVC